MILFDFDYDRPDTLEQAVALLAAHGAGARLLAGGTDLLPNMRIEVVRPEILISLSAIAPQPPRVEPDGWLRLDALTRLAGLVSSELVAARLPMLAAAAHAVAGNQIRQSGTLGGNLGQDSRCLYLNQKHDYQFTEPCYKRGGACCYPYPGNDPQTCWSVYQSDIAPALIALAAEIDILGPNGARRIGAQQLFSGSGLHPLTLAPGELIRAVWVPPAGPRCGWGFHKLARRGGLEFAMATLAVTLRLAEDGRSIAQARIAIGSVDEAPVRLVRAEQALVGLAADDQASLARVAAESAREVDPLPHHGFTKGTLRDGIRVHLRRILAQAAERAGIVLN